VAPASAPSATCTTAGGRLPGPGQQHRPS
jgi:hypothetical protein